MAGLGSFIIPRKIFNGLGALDKLKELQGKRAIIVTGKSSMRDSGIFDKAQSLLWEAGFETGVFEGVEADPSLETVLRGAEAFHSFAPDTIIGLGGCSAIDAAKLMWVFYEYPNTKFEDMINPFTIPELRKKAKFVAVPSTSGTGTEVTCFAVITDRKKGIKYPIVSYELTPDIAIVDGEIACGMPKEVTANTGIDALSHDFEAFVSILNGPYTDSLALKSIKMIFSNLKKAFDNGTDKEARQNMHDASCLAGMAFTNALLGINHALAHQLGGMFGIPHGCANAILMPEVIIYNAKEASGKYNEIAKSLNLEDWRELIQELVNLRDSLDIPGTLKEWGLSQSEFKAKLNEISQNALNDAAVGANPRKPKLEDLKQIYLSISGFATKAAAADM